MASGRKLWKVVRRQAAGQSGRLWRSTQNTGENSTQRKLLQTVHQTYRPQYTYCRRWCLNTL